MNYKTLLAALLAIMTSLYGDSLYAQQRAAPQRSQPTRITTQPAQPAQPAEMPEPDKPGLSSEPPPPRRTTQRVSYTARIASTADINQHMTWKQFLEQIPANRVAEYTPPEEINVNSRVYYENFCGPTSIADQLIWLDKNGFANIVDEGDPVIAGTMLARMLGDTKYMRTISEPGPDDFDPVVGSGTKIENLVAGTAKYLAERKVKIKNVRVISAWSPPSQAGRYGVAKSLLTLEQRLPNLYETTQPLRGKTIVVNIIGKYENVPPQFGNGKLLPGYLSRVGGHYIAPVGNAEDAGGNYSANTVIYHDPGGSPQNAKKQHYYQWIREEGPGQSLALRSNDKPRFAELACKDDGSKTCLGKVSDTYVRDKRIEDHSSSDDIWIMEGVIVIEVM